MVATGMDLQPAEIREAAHLRWHVGNDVFSPLAESFSEGFRAGDSSGD
jgi:hypothetical protein